MDKLLEHTKKKKVSWIGWIGKGFGALLILGMISAFSGKVWRSYFPHQRHTTAGDYRGWSGRSNGFAPHPSEEEGAVIQVYSARTRGTKQLFAVHTWIATKGKGEPHYITSEIFGWRLGRNGTALRQGVDVPDKDWYGNPPELLLDIRGEQAEQLIPKIEKAISNYPFQHEYTVWPGPNSNTFIAWIGKEVPELGLDLPATAIGKDWRPITDVVGYSSSGTGLQTSLWGLLGFSIGVQEGLEFNLLGLSYEIDILDLAIELPGIGRIGSDPVAQ